MSAAVPTTTAPAAANAKRAPRVRKTFTEAAVAVKEAEPPKSGAKILTTVRGIMIGAPTPIRGGNGFNATFMVFGMPAKPMFEGDLGAVQVISDGEIIHGGMTAIVDLKVPDAEDRAALKEMRKNGAAGFTAYKRNDTDFRHQIQNGNVYSVLITCGVKDAKPLKQGGVYKFGVKEWQLVSATVPGSFGDHIEAQIGEIEYIEDSARFRGAKANALLFCMHLAPQRNPLFTQLVLNSSTLPPQDAKIKVKVDDFTPATSHMKSCNFVVPFLKDCNLVSTALAGQSDETVRIFSRPAFDDGSLPKITFNPKTNAVKHTNCVSFAVNTRQLTKKPDAPEDFSGLEGYNERAYILRCGLWHNGFRASGVMDVRPMRAGLAGSKLLEHLPMISVCYSKTGKALPCTSKQGSGAQTLELNSTGDATEVFESRSCSTTADLAVGVCNAGYEITRAAAFKLIGLMENQRLVASGMEIPQLDEEGQPLAPPTFYSVRGNKITSRKDELDKPLPNNPYNELGSPIVPLLESNANLEKLLDPTKWTVLAIPSFGHKASEIMVDGAEGCYSASFAYYLELRAESARLNREPETATPAQIELMKAQPVEIKPKAKKAKKSGAAADEDDDEELSLFPTAQAYANAFMGRLICQIMAGEPVEPRLAKLFPLPKDAARAGSNMPPDVLLFAVQNDYIRGRGLGTETTHNAHFIVQSLVDQLYPADLSYLDDVGTGLGAKRTLIDPADAPVVVRAVVAPPPPADIDEPLTAAQEAALAAAEAGAMGGATAPAAVKTDTGASKRAAPSKTPGAKRHVPDSIGESDDESAASNGDGAQVDSMAVDAGADVSTAAAAAAAAPSAAEISV